MTTSKCEYNIVELRGLQCGAETEIHLSYEEGEIVRNMLPRKNRTATNEQSLGSVSKMGNALSRSPFETLAFVAERRDTVNYVLEHCVPQLPVDLMMIAVCSSRSSGSKGAAVSDLAHHTPHLQKANFTILCLAVRMAMQAAGTIPPE